MTERSIEIVQASIPLGRGQFSAIEDEPAKVNNPFLCTGIQLVIDRTQPEDIESTAEVANNSGAARVQKPRCFAPWRQFARYCQK